jgi:cell division protein FtsW (lipid II flippase)
MEGMRNNPLWLLFLLSMIISLYLSMSISADYERQPKNPKRSLVISLVGSVLICTVIGFFVAKSESNSILEGVIMGGCLFICILIPVVYIYTLRIKRQEE